MRRSFYVLIIVIIQAFPAIGQQAIFDSLRNVLKATRDKVQQVNILNDLSYLYYDYESARSYEYASQAYDLAREIKHLAGMRRSLTLKGYYFYTKGDYSQALKFYRQSAQVAIPDDDLQGYNLTMTGNAFRELAQYDSAKFFYDRSIDLLSHLNAPRQLAYAYKNLARLYVLQWKNKEAEDWLLKALKIYEQTKRKGGIADTYFSLSDVSKNKADFTAANDYVDKGCALANSVDDEFLLILCFMNRGDIKNRLGEYADALTLYFQALGILKSKDLPALLSDLYSGIGDVYMGLGQNDVSLKYYEEALKIAESLGIKYEIAKLYSSIAWVYKNIKSYDKAQEYINKSLALREEIKDDHGISDCFNTRGVIYYQQKRYREAIASLEHSLEIRERIGHRLGITSCLYNLSLVFADQKQFPKAIEYQMKGLAMEESIGNKFNIGFSHNRLGALYTNLRKFREAESYLKRAEKIGTETKSKSLLMNNYFNWAEYFNVRNDKGRALQYYKKYAAVHDSMYNDISAQKLAELQALYQVEKKDQEISLLNQEKLNRENEIKLQRSQINLQNIILASVISGFVLVSLLAFVSYRYNKRIQKANREITEQKEEIQAQSEELIDANATIAEINKKLEVKIEQRTSALSQAYKELDTFFYRSSHDFRRPLTTFLGLAEVAKVTVKDSAALELFEKVRETAMNLDKMLVKLQSISDVGAQQLFYKEVMIKEIFDTVCDTFREEIQRKNIKTSIEIKLQGPFVSYPAMIRIIFENLIENAIHFSGVVNSFIKIKVIQNGSYITIDFQDNGQGIAREYHEQVFEMYFRGNERSKGNGLGLYIVKKAVEKLDGSISLSSIPQVGSTFTIMLPMSNPNLVRG